MSKPLRMKNVSEDWLAGLDPDRLSYAAVQGQIRFNECIAPRDTTYDPHDAAYEACEHAIRAYVAQEAMVREFNRLATEGKDDV